MYNSKGIVIDDSFQNIMVGGIAAFIDFSLYVREVQIFMEKVTVGKSESLKSYKIGGFIGDAQYSMHLNNSSVVATFDVPDDDRVKLGAAVGVSDTNDWRPRLEGVFAAVKSITKKGVYLIDDKTPDTLIVNSFMECVPDTGINMSDRSCNKTDMKTAAFMDQLQNPAWKLIAGTNDGYPVLFKNIIRSQ